MLHCMSLDVTLFVISSSGAADAACSQSLACPRLATSFEPFLRASKRYLTGGSELTSEPVESALLAFPYRQRATAYIRRRQTMCSIAEARFAHAHATYEIPVGARREFGSEAIIWYLEIEAAARRKARMNKLKQTSARLWRHLIGPAGRVTITPARDVDTAVGLSN
jgi:hypothetical protein